MIQKRLAADILKCSQSRIKILATQEEIKNSIRKQDILGLISKGKIIKRPVKGTSRYRARKTRIQKIKGRQTSHGSRKGTEGARTYFKKEWMNTIRLQRKTLKQLKNDNKITKQKFRTAYKKSRGGYFRSKKHLLQYIKESQ
ncbi:50S ribosomal protein L19e [Candidatus Woesearchaeota archaeon]|nr:50S ribosomal protein L19e [Candidatus Woesearchaeota archaeon]